MISHSLYSLLQPLKLLQNCIYGNSFSFRLHVPGFVFTLANPLGTMPVFLSMTRGLSDQERNSIVWRATLISFVTLLIFTFAGQFLFKFFGISANGFRIAAGFIIFKIGYDMLQAHYTTIKSAMRNVAPMPRT